MHTCTTVPELAIVFVMGKGGEVEGWRSGRVEEWGSAGVSGQKYIVALCSGMWVTCYGMCHKLPQVTHVCDDFIPSLPLSRLCVGWLITCLCSIVHDLELITAKIPQLMPRLHVF